MLGVSGSSAGRKGQPSSQALVDILNMLGLPGSVAENDRQQMDNHLKPDLFHVPNHWLFPKVIYFLLGLLDAARREEDFRYCWPILDKKAETQFRKAAYQWYKEIQQCNASKLPQVALAVWMSPGGRKFLDFINPFAKFVAYNKLFKSATDEEGNNNIIMEAHFLGRVHDASRKSLLKSLKTRNSLETRKVFEEVKRVHNLAQDQSQSMADSFRKLKAELVQLNAAKADLDKAIGAKIQSSDSATTDSDNVSSALCAGCERLCESSLQTFRQIEAFHATALNLGGKIDAVLREHSSPGDRPTLDVTGLTTSGNNDDLAEVLRKLFSSVADAATAAAAATSSTNSSCNFPLDLTAQALEFVRLHQGKFSKQDGELQGQLPELTEAVETLEHQVLSRYEARAKSGFLWKLWELDTSNDEGPALVRQATVRKEDVEFDFVLSDFGLSQEEIARKDAFYRLARESVVAIDNELQHESIASDVTANNDVSSMSTFMPIMSSSRVEINSVQKLTATNNFTTDEKVKRLTLILEESVGGISPLSPLHNGDDVKTVMTSVATPNRTPVMQRPAIDLNKLLAAQTPLTASHQQLQTPMMFKSKKFFEGQEGISDCCSPSTLFAAAASPLMTSLSAARSPLMTSLSSSRSPLLERKNNNVSLLSAVPPSPSPAAVAAPVPTLKFQLSPLDVSASPQPLERQEENLEPPLESMAALEKLQLEDEDEVLFAGINSQKIATTKKPQNRRSAIKMQKRLSELTKTISVAQNGERELGSKDGFGSLLADEPDITEDLDLSL